MVQMQIEVLPMIILIIYLIGMLSIGFLSNKFMIKNSNDYLLGGRRIGLLFVAASLSANNVGGGSTTGVATRAFSGWGLSAGWYVLAASVAMIPLAYFAPKIRKAMAYTIPEVITRRFGSGVGTISAVLNIVSLFCLTASLDIRICVVLATALVLFYTSMGGLIADSIADLFQWIIIFGGLLISLPFIIQGAGGWEAVTAKLPAEELDFTKVGWFTIISLILNYFCTFLSGPEIVSRFASSEDEGTARKAAWLSDDGSHGLHPGFDRSGGAGRGSGAGRRSWDHGADVCHQELRSSHYHRPGFRGYHRGYHVQQRLQPALLLHDLCERHLSEIF